MNKIQNQQSIWIYFKNIYLNALIIYIQANMERTSVNEIIRNQISPQMFADPIIALSNWIRLLLFLVFSPARLCQALNGVYVCVCVCFCACVCVYVCVVLCLSECVYVCVCL